MIIGPNKKKDGRCCLLNDIMKVQSGGSRKTNGHRGGLVTSICLPIPHPVFLHRLVCFGYLALARPPTRNISFHFSLTNVLISGYLAVIVAVPKS